jgi:hypothetical protein
VADEEELTRAEQVAKRAMELSARAEELARQAHEVSGVDEQLAALEAELDALAAEEESLDAGVEGGAAPPADDGVTSDEAPPEGADEREGIDFNYPEFAQLAEAFGQRMEALGERIGDLVSHRLDSAFKRGEWKTGGRWGGRWGDVAADVGGPLPVRVSTKGGRVAVRTGPAGRVTVHWNLHGPFAQPDGEDPVTITERDGVLYVEATGRPVMRGIGLEIEVPAGCALDVSTGGGGVDVHGTGAGVRAKTGGGGVTVSDAAGEVVLETGGGSISFQGRPSGQSLLRTGGGSIDVVLAAGTAVDIDARGSMASVDVDGREVKGGRVQATVGGGGQGTLTARTGGGTVRVRQG